MGKPIKLSDAAYMLVSTAAGRHATHHRQWVSRRLTPGMSSWAVAEFSEGHAPPWQPHHKVVTIYQSALRITV